MKQLHGFNGACSRLRPLFVKSICALCMLSIVSCSTLSPQVFSPATVPDVSANGTSQPATHAPLTMPEAIMRTEGLRAQYLRAVRDLSEARSASNATMIVLAALGLTTAVYKPTSRALPVLGILGASIYGYGTSMISLPQQQIFNSGAKALTCALTASRPFDISVDWLTGRDASNPSLSMLTIEVGTEIVALDSKAESLRTERDKRGESVSKGRDAPSDCQRVGADICPRTDDSADGRRLQSLCEARQARCKAVPSTSTTLEPHPDISKMLGRIIDLKDRLLALKKDGAAVLGEADSAGQKLWDKAEMIQNLVSEEVLKAEPDLTKVQAAASGIQANALKLTALSKQPVNATQAGQVQSDGTTNKKYQPRPDSVIQQAEVAYVNAANAGEKLDIKLLIMRQRISSVTVPLSTCNLTVPGNQTLETQTTAPNAAKSDPQSAAGSAAVVDGLLMDTTQYATKELKASLNLDEGSTSAQVVDQVAKCQQQKLKMSGADGKTLNTQTLLAIVSGQCKGLT